MSWIKGVASSYIDLSDQVVAAATGTSLQSADSVANGGTGYSVGDILTLSGGTATIAAQVEVTAVSGGVVTAVRRVNDGVYSAAPSDPVSTTGGGGSGCTLNCTFAANGWTDLIDQVYSGSDREVMLQGEGGGTDEIYIGWRTFFNSGGNYYNWELHGMTGYDSGLPWEEQPGMSPGFFDGALATDRAGAYLLCSNGSVAYWLSVTPYRIIGIVKVGSSYFPFYLGWGNRFATAGEYPYPLVVSGCTSLYKDQASQSKLTSGLTDPWRSTDSEGSTRGPMLVYMTDGSWYGVANSSVGASSRTPLGSRVVMPCGRSDAASYASTPDKFVYDQFPWSDLIYASGLSGTANASLHPTPDSGGDVHHLVPAIVVFWDPSPQMPVEIDNVFWTSAFGGVVSEDRIIYGGEVYRVFQNCNRSDVYSYLAVREG